MFCRWTRRWYIRQYTLSAAQSRAPASCRVTPHREWRGQSHFKADALPWASNFTVPTATSSTSRRSWPASAESARTAAARWTSRWRASAAATPKTNPRPTRPSRCPWQPPRTLRPNRQEPRPLPQRSPARLLPVRQWPARPLPARLLPASLLPVRLLPVRLLPTRPCRRRRSPQPWPRRPAIRWPTRPTRCGTFGRPPAANTARRAPRRCAAGSAKAASTASRWFGAKAGRNGKRPKGYSNN